MNIFLPLPVKSYQKSWVTIGSFDGVHLGHQSLIKELVESAHGDDNPAIVITFWPHPATFFHRVPQSYALTSPEERTFLIKKLGVDEVITLGFNEALSELDALSFMSKIKDLLDVRKLIVGPNFTLGKNRSGDNEQLRQIGKKIGFSVEVKEPFLIQDKLISSSQIRQDLASNQVRDANQKLGRAYSLKGTVTHGEHRGTHLGIPTANLAISPERLIPAKGVYVTRATVDGKNHAAVTNIGVRPTFENPLIIPRVEPHLLDMQEQLYGKELTLEFIDFLRPEIKFENPQALVSQIKLDIEKTRKILQI
jgi:riboflavin kinase/FMN adenylyltransferase